MKVVAIDPGQETGIVEADLRNGTMSIVGRTQIKGGLAGLLGYDYFGCLEEWEPDYIVYEKFSPLPTARAYRLNELEPIRIEGAIEASPWHRTVLVPQRTMALTIAGSHGSPAANKKAADNFLRDCGLWTTGSQIGAKDANDVNAAMKHLVAWARTRNDIPDPHDWKMDG